MSNGSQDSGETTTFQSGPHELPKLEWLSLPVIDLNAKGPTAQFELGELLGQGGMGRVLSARQNTLQRAVAIKFLNDENGDSEHLLREAITTGRLEHPNIVPVHVLGKTAEGAPFFTMKRVEGTPWNEALRSAKPIFEHLEVLQRVSDAIAFAHSQGVVHRDVKPSNVLIGSFGEVYLVDWGLAVSMRRDSVLPLASEASLAGTPAYISPEAAQGVGLGPWTDVFLLGATLYEILMGRPPWVAGSVVETLKIALEPSELRFDTFVPAELANICRRAMQRDPMARFESAKAFRDAITGYLRHREALELHELTMAKLNELERAGGDDRLFTECRFGFEMVRRAFPEFEPARAGLRRTLVLMVQREIERKAPRVARALLGELEQPPAELVMKVEDAERAEKEAAERLIALEKQARDLSPDAARDPKAFYLRGLAVFSAAAAVFGQVVESTGTHHFTAMDGLIFAGVLLLNAIFYVGWLSTQADMNQLQRRMSAAIAGLALLSTLGWGLAARADVSFSTAVVLFFLINSAGWWTAAVTIELRGTTVAMGFALAAIIGLVFPQYAIGGGACVGISMWILSNLLRTPERAA